MIVALGLLLLSPTVFCHDSEGTLFYWNYLRNADSNTAVPNQNLSVTILNGANGGSCDFTMFYREDFFTDLVSKTITVPANSSVSMSVPSYYGFAYDSRETPQTSQVPNVTLSANSSCPVTLLANNYDFVTGQGDTFMVLPVNWASTFFTFTLPPAMKDDLQYQVVTFISSQGTANVQMNIVEHDGGSPLTFQVNTMGGMTDYIALTTPDGLPRTYRIQSDQPIQVVAGVTCVGVYGGSCDHVAFMPQPVPSFDCRSYEWVDDDHVSDTVSTGSFYIDIPSTCPITQNVTATSAGGSSQRQVQLVTLNPSKISVLQNYSSFGRAVSFHAGGSATHITRVYDSSSAGGKGAFVTSVASLTSFILAPSYFYTRNANDSIEVICTSLVCSAIYIDDSGKLDTASSDVISVDGVSYFSMTYVVPTPGIHFITYRNTPSSGGYTYYVIGKSNNYGYGYLGHVKLPSLVVLPTTAPPSSVSTITPLPNTMTSGMTTTTVTTPSTVSTITTASTTSTSPTTTTTSPPITTSTTSSSPTSSTSTQTTVTSPTTSSITSSTASSPTTSSTSTSSTTTLPVVTQTTSTSVTSSSTPTSTTQSTTTRTSTSTTTTSTTSTSTTSSSTTTTTTNPTTSTTLTSPTTTTSPPTTSTTPSTTTATTSTTPSTTTTSTSTSTSTSRSTSTPVVTPSPTTASTPSTVTTPSTAPPVTTMSTKSTTVTSPTTPSSTTSTTVTSPTTSSTTPSTPTTSSSTTSTTRTPPTTPSTTPSTSTAPTVTTPTTTTTTPAVTSTTTTATTTSPTTPSTAPTNPPQSSFSPMIWMTLCLIIINCIL